MPAEKEEYARVLFMQLDGEDPAPEYTTARIEKILKHNLLDYDYLDEAGKKSSDEMKIEVDRREILAQVRLARSAYKRLKEVIGDPDSAINTISYSLGRAKILKDKHLDNQEIQKIKTGYGVLDEMGLSTDDAVHAEIPKLREVAYIKQARRDFDKMLNHVEERHAGIWISSIGRGLRAAFGQKSEPECYAALDETGRATAKEMIEEIIRRAGIYLTKDHKALLTGFLRQYEKDAQAGNGSPVRSHRRPGGISSRQQVIEQIIRRKTMRRAAQPG